MPDEKWVEELDRRLDEEAAAERVSGEDDEEEVLIPSTRTIARFYYQDGLHWLEQTMPADHLAKVVRPVRERDSEEFPVEWNNYVQRRRWMRNKAGPGPLFAEAEKKAAVVTPEAKRPKNPYGEEVSDYDLLPDE